MIAAGVTLPFAGTLQAQYILSNQPEAGTFRYSQLFEGRAFAADNKGDMRVDYYVTLFDDAQFRRK